MKKIFLLLFCIIILVGIDCSHHQGTPPPSPQPPGDNSPAPPLPPPILPPQTQPIPTPPPPQTQPVRPKPKTKIGDRIVTIGAYGIFASATSDYQKIAKDIYDSKYTGAVVFLDNEFVQVPGKEYWPYPFENGKFNMDKDNPVYYKRLSDMLDAFEWYGLDIIICFDSQYFTSNWAKYMASKIHPYRQNTYGVNWGDCGKPLECQQRIYDSISFTNPPTFWWLSWKDVSEPQNKFIFSTVGKFGAARARWINKVMDMVAVKKTASPNKMWRIGWKRANEEEGKIDPLTGKTSHALSLGDRSEIYAYMYEQWQKHGLTPDGKTFFAFVNRGITGGTDSQQNAAWSELHKGIVRKYGISYGMGAIHEVHIDGTNDRARLMLLGFLPANTFFSTDGMPKENAAQYAKANRDMYLKGDPFVDILYEEGIWGSEPQKPQYFQQNWDKYFPFHKVIVKEKPVE